MSKQIKLTCIIVLTIIFLGLGNITQVNSLQAQSLYRHSQINNSWLLTQQASENQPTTNNPPVNNYPVTLGNQQLFNLVQPLANISPETRAKNASQAITKVADNSSFTSEQIVINELSSNFVLISVEDISLITLTQADAEVLGITLAELANSYREKIIEAINLYQKSKSPQEILIQSAIALVISILFLLLAKLISVAGSWLAKIVKSSENTLLKNIKIQGLQLISRKQQKVIILTVIKVITIAIYLFLFLTYLGFVFRLFPQTKTYGDTVFSAFQSAATNIFSALVNYLPNLFIIVITLVITYYTIRFSNTVFKAIRTGRLSIPGFYQEWAEPTGRLMVFFIYALALAVIFPYLPGSGSPAFQGISIFLGALFTFGGASAVSNLIGGVIIIYTRAYQLGDLVKVGEVIGNVLEKTILSTRIRTPNNQIVTIPNSTIVSSNIINYTATNRELKEPLILSTTITLGYDIPWRKVHQVLIDAALATKNLSTDFEPFVLQTALNDFYVNYELKVYTKLGLAPLKVPQLYSELHQNIQDKCNENDIEILSPHYHAVRDGSHTTIPSNYLPDNYQPPGFKIDR